MRSSVSPASELRTRVVGTGSPGSALSRATSRSAKGLFPRVRAHLYGNYRCFVLFSAYKMLCCAEKGQTWVYPAHASGNCLK
jgi:hypothetical protein